jgi:hypothetical protein
VSFHVTWDPEARKDRAYLWATAPDPAAVRAACDAAEAALARDPYQGTTFLSEGLWRLVVPPVTVYFEIDPVGRQVKITDVLPAP